MSFKQSFCVNVCWLEASLTWLAVRASRVWSLSRTLCMSSCSLANATTICSFRLPLPLAAPPQWPPPPPPVLCRASMLPEPRLGDLEPTDHRTCRDDRIIWRRSADTHPRESHLSPFWPRSCWIHPRWTSAWEASLRCSLHLPLRTWRPAGEPGAPPGTPAPPATPPQELKLGSPPHPGHPGSGSVPTSREDKRSRRHGRAPAAA